MTQNWLLGQIHNDQGMTFWTSKAVEKRGVQETKVKTIITTFYNSHDKSEAKFA